MVYKFFYPGSFFCFLISNWGSLNNILSVFPLVFLAHYFSTFLIVAFFFSSFFLLSPLFAFSFSSRLITSCNMTFKTYKLV